MKILLINKFFYLKGGAERYFFELGELLEKKGHEVIYFSMDHPNNRQSKYSKYFASEVNQENPGLNFKGLKDSLRIFWSFNARKKIKQLIKDKKPEIAHIHNIYGQLSPSILGVLKKNKIPVVMTVHDYKMICPNYILFTKGNACTRCKKRKYYNSVFYKCQKNSIIASLLVCLELYFHKLFKLYERNIDLYLCPSKFMKQKFEQFEIKGKKLILPYFLNIENYKPNYTNQDYFLFFGRVSKEKGIKVLIEAWKQLDKNIKLIIAGTGPEENEINNLIKKNKLNIEMVGAKKGAVLKKLVQNSTAVILPSVWYDNSPLVIYESFALGKPVIGSEMGGIPEMIENNKTGFVFGNRNTKELAKIINKFVKNKNLSEKIGKQAREFISRDYSADAHYKKIIRIYKNLLK